MSSNYSENILKTYTINVIESHLYKRTERIVPLDVSKYK